MKVRIEVDFDANSTKASIKKWGKRVLVTLLTGGVIVLAFGIGSAILEKKKARDRQERYEAVKAYLDSCEKAKPPKAQVKLFEYTIPPELLVAEANGTLTSEQQIRLHADRIMQKSANDPNNAFKTSNPPPSPIPDSVIANTNINAPCE